MSRSDQKTRDGRLLVTCMQAGHHVDNLADVLTGHTGVQARPATLTIARRTSRVVINRCARAAPRLTNSAPARAAGRRGIEGPTMSYLEDLSTPDTARDRYRDTGVITGIGS